MRVQAFKPDGTWTTYDIRTTYRMGWMDCLSYARVLYDFLDNPEVLSAVIAGAERNPITIKQADDIWQIPEGGVIVIRGNNKVYDNEPFQFAFFNQLDVVHMDVPTPYLSSLKRSETEFLDEDGKKHTFDKFLDSVEINGEHRINKKYAHDAVNALITAITTFCPQKENESADHLIFRNKATDTEVDISALCKTVFERYQRTSPTLECPSCHHTWEFDDSNIPNGESYEITCPKCGMLLKRKKI